MKKLITTLTAVSLAASMMTPLVSFAGSVNLTDGTGTSKASTTYAETYTITIPDNVSSNSGADMSIDVTASEVLLNPGNTLNVTVTSNGELKNEADEATTVAYELKKDDEAVTDAPFLTIASGATTGSASLTVAVTGTPTKAGTYSDTLTFSASVDPAQTAE